MAQVFLSYAREDRARAVRIADAMEGAGHQVWWDRRIDAGSRFSAEIAEALKAADVVVVLWSPASIDSVWVQDEAAFGRDHGRLVPAMLGPIEPPLGFRQFHAIDLGKAGRRIELLLNAVATRLGQPPTPPKQVRRASLWSGHWRWIAAVAALLVLIGLSWLFVPRGGGEPSHIVAVTAAKGGDERRAGEMARMIAADLGRFRAGPLGALTVLGGEKAGDADYRVEVGVSASGDDLRTDISLIATGDSNILWSTTEEGKAAQAVDLRQRAVAKLGDVLGCAVEASAQGQKLPHDMLGLYLNGCGRMSDQIFFAPNQEILSTFRQLTEKAPDFAPGWAYLAILEAQTFPGTPAPDRAALRKDLIAHLAKAKQLGPDLPQTIAADAYFHPNDGTKPQHALPILERGLKRHPDSALLHLTRALFLGDVGRQNEAIIAAERAVGLNPLSPVIRDSYISAIAYAGRTRAAYEELKKAESIWPGSTVLEQARYRLDLRYGDPKAALQTLRKRGAGDLRPVPMDTAWTAFLEARIQPSPARIEKALASFRERYRRNRADIPGYLQALGTFGRVDEAFEVTKPAVTLDSMMVSTETLFRAHMRPIRSDPRFIALAAKLGLLQYWEKTGVWADFCDEPQLPYNCKAEAARLTPEQRKLAKLFIS